MYMSNDHQPSDPATRAVSPSSYEPDNLLDRCEQLEQRVEELTAALANHKPTAAATPVHDEYEFGAAIGRLLAWIVEPKKISAIGTRALIACLKVRPDLINGLTLDGIAKLTGHGRSATHKLAKEFTQIFGIRGKNDKSLQACKKFKAAYWKAIQKKKISKPHSTQTPDNE